MTALVLAAVMALSLAECGGGDTALRRPETDAPTLQQHQRPADPQEDPTPGEPVADPGENPAGYDEQGAMTLPFDQLYPELVEKEQVAFDDETLLLKLPAHMDGTVTEAMADAGAVNNGDGVIDAGETIALGLTLRNRWGKGDDLTVTLDTLSMAGIPDPSIPLSVQYGSATPFRDYGIEGEFVDARTWVGKKLLTTVIENGTQYFNISNGCSATEFGVGGICNRAQVVTFPFRSFSNP